MFSDASNPYASPTFDASPPPTIVGHPYLGADYRKVEAIVKDAELFWVALLLCLLCNVPGFLICGPWYGFRIWQWQSMAAKHPQLLMEGAEPRSVEYCFQRARWKLLVGMVLGATIFLLLSSAMIFWLSIPVAAHRGP